MCNAHVLRFCCGHGILMAIEPCALAPCPIIKPTGVRLPRQPFRCYNCQHKLSSSTSTPSLSRDSSCTSSVGSLESVASFSSSSSDGRPKSASRSTSSQSKVTHPLPGVIRQPTGSVQYCHNFNKKPSSIAKPFSFSCSSSNHYPTPHYATLPTFLPHQDHPCPPCQIEDLRSKSDQEVASAAKAEYPHLTGDMMVRNGRKQDGCEWLGKMTMETYVDEKRLEDRQTWLCVTRKWTQDLKRAKVLLAEEDGLGLFA